jgi:hypothetical protein
MTLLHTRDGNYSAVCSLDFKDPPRYYDTFALRDINGKAGFSEYYPIFGSRVSRKALVSQSPVPVKSCWNGIGAQPGLTPSDLVALTLETQPFSMPSPL